MKLLWIHIQDDDCKGIMEELKQCGYRATMISSTEDFLNYGETNFLLGVDNQDYEAVVKMIKEYYANKYIIGKQKEKVSIYVLHAEKY